ncbi:MAG: hypothetical protein IKB95_05255 [Bacteroidales bacterium]|nr:hypothetical protein [Bacteroidales bacterium]MBR4215029.1 hypothetical protein [Bacteroidales bacterium]
MCTITLEYDQNSALARRKLAMLLATGLFMTKEIMPDKPESNEKEDSRQEVEAFFSASKKSMSNVIARYL